MAGASALGSLAGCVVGGNPVVGTVNLDPEHDDQGDESYLVFRRDGERMATIGLLVRASNVTRGEHRFRMHISHAENSHVDRLRYGFRVPTGPNGPFPEFYLKRPDGGPWPAITFERGDDTGTTIFEMDDIGFVGNGSITLDFVLEYAPEDGTIPLSVDALAALSGQGFGQYEAAGRLEHEFGASEDA